MSLPLLGAERDRVRQPRHGAPGRRAEPAALDRRAGRGRARADRRARGRRRALDGRLRGADDRAGRGQMPSARSSWRGRARAAPTACAGRLRSPLRSPLRCGCPTRSSRAGRCRTRSRRAGRRRTPSGSKRSSPRRLEQPDAVRDDRGARAGLLRVLRRGLRGRADRGAARSSSTATEDVIVPVENGRRLAQRLPNAEYVELRGLAGTTSRSRIPGLFARSSALASSRGDRHPDLERRLAWLAGAPAPPAAPDPRLVPRPAARPAARRDLPQRRRHRRPRRRPGQGRSGAAGRTGCTRSSAVASPRRRRPASAAWSTRGTSATSTWTRSSGWATRSSPAS